MRFSHTDWPGGDFCDTCGPNEDCTCQPLCVLCGGTICDEGTALLCYDCSIPESEREALLLVATELERQAKGLERQAARASNLNVSMALWDAARRLHQRAVEIRGEVEDR